MGTIRSWTVFVLVGFLAGCVPEQQKEVKPGEKAIILTGTVLPYREAEVMSPISAVVDQVLVKPGRKVQAGQVLLMLDQSAVRAEVARADAALATARMNLDEARPGVQQSRRELRRQKMAAGPSGTTEYDQARIVLENAKAKLERLYALLARRLVSKPEVEAAQNHYAEARRRVQASKAALQASPKHTRIKTALAQVRKAEAELARARYNQERTTLTAPISGIVTEVIAQIGQKIYEGRPLLRIVDIDRVRVKAELSPGLLPYVHVGQKAMVTVNTVPPTDVRSDVGQIEPVANPETQSLGLSFILLNPGFKFQPGFTARVEIPVDGMPSKEDAAEEQRT